MEKKIQLKLDSSREIRRRGEIDIMASILNEAHRGARKTHIMYRCNLSYRQLEAYLKLLLRMGFLAPHSERGSSKLDRFKSTAKGLQFVDAYRTVRALMT